MIEQSRKVLHQGLVLFVFAAIFAFGFVTLLQFMAFPWLFIALLLMHVGIFSFIASKRMLKKVGFNVRSYYRFQYLLLIPYLFGMAYAFLHHAGILPLFSEAKLLITLAYSAVCFVLTIWNFVRMKNDLQGQHQAIDPPFDTKSLKTKQK